MDLQNQNPTDEAPEPSPETASEELSLPQETEQAPQASAPIAESEPDAVVSDSAAAPDEDEYEVRASESDHHDDVAEEEASETPEGEAPRFRRGTLLEGTVVESSASQVIIDLGDGLTGGIPAREIEFLDKSIAESLEPGTPITVMVLRATGEGGGPVLSVSRALEEMDWRQAEEYAKNREVYPGRIAGYNKGGLIVRFGRLRGFIPASQISQERNERASGDDPDQKWSDMLNEEIMVKVVEVNRSRNRLILSERAAAREYRELQKEKLINELALGEIREGRVISLTDFGAFVDLGGADGLIHLTELSWKHVSHPREVVNIGDLVKAKVISIDPERKRIGLSLRSLETDPWDEVAARYGENQLVQGKITKLTRFGAFASLMDNAEVEGLIHVSELADYRVEHPRDVVAVGDVLTLRVLKVDAQRRRLALSLKRVNSARYMSTDWNEWSPEE